MDSGLYRIEFFFTSGYGEVVDHSLVGFDVEPDMPGPVPFWLDDLACHGNETALSSCPHSMWGTHDCSPNDAVGLACTGKI